MIQPYDLFHATQTQGLPPCEPTDRSSDIYEHLEIQFTRLRAYVILRSCAYMSGTAGVLQYTHATRATI